MTLVNIIVFHHIILYILLQNEAAPSIPEFNALVSEIANPIVMAILSANSSTAWNISSEISFTIVNGSENEMAERKPVRLSVLHIELIEGVVMLPNAGMPVVLRNVVGIAVGMRVCRFQECIGRI